MNALGIIFSELHDKNIPELTQVRTLASVPFGGRYRFIDFMLSSLVNSGVARVGIITKSNYRSLMDHIGSGKSWDLSRKNGGVIVLPPHGESEGLFRTRVEAIKSIYKFIKDSKEEYVILSDCDNVCNIKFDEVLEKHIAKNADITAVYREKYIRDSEKLVFEMNDDERVQRAYICGTEGRQLAWANILLLKKSFLIDLIENAFMQGYENLHDIIIKNLNQCKVYGYKFTGFYASVDSLKNYFKHSLELLDKQKRDSLFKNDGRPIYTKVRDSAPARFSEDARAQNSMIADGCVIEGEVINSVLFRGVKVSKGARVENSILMQGSIISEGCRLNCVITDKNVVVREKRVLSGHERLPYYISKGTIL